MEQILRILAEEGRLTTAQIAERVGKTEDEVKALIVQAQKDGLIVKYKAVVNWEKAGVDEVFAFIEVKVSPQRGVGFDAIAERIMGFPEVHSLYLMSGAYDLHVVVKGKTMRDIAFFVAEKLAPLEGVHSTSSHFVLKRYKMDGDIMEPPAQPERLAVTP
jgi:DNA-binding Lrp family transcriptional regulator